MPTLSVVIPAYNEERSLSSCVQRVIAIAEADLHLEILIVDDASTDATARVAEDLARRHPEVRLLRHAVNQGKGAALHTGFRAATGDFVAVQDADLEYDPRDLKRLLAPLVDGRADVVLGSRFLSAGEHRVLYFWHSVGNRLLTLLSNMFTDLNLTDMETCYKVFRREVLQRITLHEQRFGFEPEIVASVARLRLRIYEMGISYSGRTYEEGKKIGAKDGVRALYCIIRYNMPYAPLPIQFAAYAVLGGICALANIAVFMALLNAIPPAAAAPIAFVMAALLNYWFCVSLLFKPGARWSRVGEVFAYAGVVAASGAVDFASMMALLAAGVTAIAAKATGCGVALAFNFLGRRFVVFPEQSAGEWAPAAPSAVDSNALELEAGPASVARQAPSYRNVRIVQGGARQQRSR
jgi:glycosyltransferase involved in cell wall biosynthesis